MRLRVHPDNPQERLLRQAVEVVKTGGVMIYPTDTVYAIGCAIGDQKAVEKICKLRGLNPKKANLSIICNDISQLSDYVIQLDNYMFRELKRIFPGPYTVILKGNKNLPKIFKNNKKTIGIRIPDNPITKKLVDLFGQPILTASLKWEDDIIEYPTDIEEIVDYYERQVDVIIDSGYGGNTPSTVLDGTDSDLTLIRLGKGEWEE